MVNARLCEMARLALFLASPRHFDFLDCETETSKCFETPRHLRIKKRDCEMHITTPKARLRNPWNLTKILQDPEFLKNHSPPLILWSILLFIYHWSTSKTGNKQIFLFLTFPGSEWWRESENWTTRWSASLDSVLESIQVRQQFKSHVSAPSLKDGINNYHIILLKTWLISNTTNLVVYFLL